MKAYEPKVIEDKITVDVKVKLTLWSAIKMRIAGIRSPINIDFVYLSCRRITDDSMRINGVYDSEDKAKAACIKEDDFVTWVKLNDTENSDDCIPAPGYYPLLK